MKQRFLLLFLVLFVTQGVVLGAEPEYVEPTKRLNMRECPQTTTCRVIRTLPAETLLEVTGKRGEWFSVRVVEGRATGWVHGDYVTKALGPVSTVADEQESEESQGSSIPWGVLLFVMGGLVVIASVGSRLRERTSFATMLGVVCASGLVGSVLLLNQFGPILSEGLKPWINLSPLSVLWGYDLLGTAGIGYPAVLGFLLLVSCTAALAAPKENGRRQSFLQGLATGYCVLPGLVLLGLAAWLVVKILKLIIVLLVALATPLIWLVQNFLLPLLGWLATPLAWLWENGVRDLLLWLATPLIWLKVKVLGPLFGFLSTYLFQPLMGVAFRLLIATGLILPVCIPGLALIASIRSSLAEKLDSRGLFSYGVGQGFLLFDGCLLIALNAFGLLDATPPLTLLLPVAVSVIGLLRLLAAGRNVSSEQVSPSFVINVQYYLSRSWIDLVASMLLIPLNIIARGLLAGFAESD